MATTGPWSHAGAYDSLEAVVRHHLDPVASLHAYELDEALLPPLGEVVELTASGSRLSQGFMAETRRNEFARSDSWVQKNDALRQRIADANELAAVPLADEDVRALVAFLQALTDPMAARLDALVPGAVPSGLPVED